MTYEECLRATYLDLSSWIIVVVGLGAALALAKSGRTIAAMVAAVATLLAGLFWGYAYYTLNCVELYPG